MKLSNAKPFVPKEIVYERKQKKIIPPSCDEKNFYGLSGQIVRGISPFSEADPIALLIQLLIAFGNLIGRMPHFLAEADRHGTNLNGIFSGDTSKGRKGSSWGHIIRLMRLLADE